MTFSTKGDCSKARRSKAVSRSSSNRWLWATCSRMETTKEETP